MDISALKAELLAGHPDTGAYDADDVIAAAELNAVNRSKNKSSMTGSEIINALDKTEYLALSDADTARVWQICHLGTINPFGVEADLFINIFGGGSASIAALQDARKDDASRAVEIGLGVVFPTHVTSARAYHG
ncbi:MAG: hypothetical protein ACYS29_00960 [Planctomycetota bacterium]